MRNFSSTHLRAVAPLAQLDGLFPPDAHGPRCLAAPTPCSDAPQSFSSSEVAPGFFKLFKTIRILDERCTHSATGRPAIIQNRLMCAGIFGSSTQVSYWDCASARTTASWNLVKSSERRVVLRLVRLYVHVWAPPSVSLHFRHLPQ